MLCEKCKDKISIADEIEKMFDDSKLGKENAQRLYNILMKLKEEIIHATN